MSDFKNSKLKKAITFSYDDGVVQDIRLVELFNKYNLKCTFNINSELLGTTNQLIRQGQRICHYKIHPRDVKDLYEGHEVAAHTLTHPLLPSLTDEEVIYQVEEDRKKLSGMVGYDVVGMAYPCGRENNDDRVAATIKSNTNIRYARTIIENFSFDVQDNLYRFNPTVYHLRFDKMTELAEQFLNSNPEKPQIFYIWGHSYEMDFDTKNWYQLEEFFKLISNRDDVFYGTNKEILL